MWVVVEKLTNPAQWSVLAAHDRLRDRGSLQRVVRDVVENHQAANAVLRELVKRLNKLTEDHPGFLKTVADGAATIAGGAICGPDYGNVWAASIWIAPGSETPTTMRPLWDVRAFCWDSHDRFVRTRNPLTHTSERLTAPEATSTLKIEDAERFFGALLDDETGSDIVAADGRVGQNSTFPTRLICVHDKANPGEWKGLLLRSRTAEKVPPTQGLDQLSVDALVKVLPNPVHLALMDVSRMRLVTWLTEPVAGVQWKGMVDDRDTPHPNDVATIFQRAAAFSRGESTREEIAGVRLRATGGGWIVSDVRATLLTPATAPVGLLLVSFAVVGFSTEPDPVPTSASVTPA